MEFVVFAKRLLQALPPKAGDGDVCLPAFAQACYAAVVLVPSVLIQHASMHNVPHWHIQVVGEEVLQALQRLISCGLREMRVRPAV